MIRQVGDYCSAPVNLSLCKSRNSGGKNSQVSQTKQGLVIWTWLEREDNVIIVIFVPVMSKEGKTGQSSQIIILK